MKLQVDTLSALESEAIFILREVKALFEHPVLLFSGGKDSIVLLHLLKKAFYPARIPFPVMHIDTGHNFEETLVFRDYICQKNGVELLVAKVQDAIDRKLLIDESGYDASRNTLQTYVLLEALEKNRFDAAIGGGRRDEEKSRAKERIFSHRNAFGQWEPKNQRPELWQLFNTKKHPGEHFRVFPLSNWTELDIWQYIHTDTIEIPSIYLCHQRTVFERNGMLLADSPYVLRRPQEIPFEAMVRCRTIGDMTNTGMWLSTASNTEEIISELLRSEYTERGRRADDKRSDASLEERKREGYF